MPKSIQVQSREGLGYHFWTKPAPCRVQIAPDADALLENRARLAWLSLVRRNFLGPRLFYGWGPVASVTQVPCMLQIPHLSHRLENGLTVILHQDQRLPIVALNLWYRVGSKDEPPGRTGFAHLFEHLMFMGTAQVPEGYFDQIMERLGGANNASTSPDRTAYVSWGPREILSTLLWLEADRMANLGHDIDQEKLDLQREVVRNERRQSYENRPYGKTWLELPGHIYPQGHPYHHPVIGSHADLEAATVEDVKTFFQSWYTPDNASLVIAGDFDPHIALAEVEKYFASIPPSQHGRTRSTPKAFQLDANRYVTVEDHVPAPRVVFAWPSPKLFAPGDAELELLADILGDGPASRLEESLVTEMQIAHDVSAFQSSGALGSEFGIEVTALADGSLEAIENAITQQIDRIINDGLSAEECHRVRAQAEADFIRSLEETQSRADDLNHYQTWLGSPDCVQQDLDRYVNASVERIESAARDTLNSPHLCYRIEVARGVSSGTPTNAPESPALPENDAGSSQRALASNTTFSLPKGAPRVRLTSEQWLPPIPQAQDLGRNGRLWTVERAEVPLVSVLIGLPLGARNDPAGQAGVHHLSASLLEEGAGGKDAAELAAALDALGTELEVSTGRETTVLSLSTLKRNLKPSLALLSDVLLRPHLEAEDLERVRELTLDDIRHRDSSPESLAATEARRRLFAGRPKDLLPIMGDTQTIESVSLEHCQQCHGERVSALEHARVMAVGDFESSELKELLSECLPFASEGSPHRWSKAAIPMAEGPGLSHPLQVVRETASQTTLQYLQCIPPEGDIRSQALRIAVMIFGGMFTSRLNTNLRERHGYTYGAHASISQSQRSGILSVSTSIQSSKVPQALEQIGIEFDRLHSDPFSAAECKKAQEAAKNDATWSCEAVASLASQLFHFLLSGGDPETFSERVRNLDLVTPTQIRATAQALIRPQSALLLAVRGEEDGISLSS